MSEIFFQTGIFQQLKAVSAQPVKLLVRHETAAVRENLQTFKFKRRISGFKYGFLKLHIGHRLIFGRLDHSPFKTYRNIAQR